MLAKFSGLELKGTSMNLWVWSKKQNINSRSKRVNFQICSEEVYAYWLRNYMGLSAVGDTRTAVVALKGWHSSTR